MAGFLTMKDMSLDGKRVLVRVDFNVPIKNGVITDDTRLVASIPTIKYLLGKGCTVILMSHLGRPSEELKAGKSPEEVQRMFTLGPIAERLSKLLGMEVVFADGSIGVASVTKQLPPNRLVLLENVQLNKGETKNDEGYARQLAAFGDIYVNDAFAQCHREYATFCAITRLMPSCAGLLVEKEINELGKVVNPAKPFVAIVGGAKADKIGALKAIAQKADHVLVGGVLANTLLKARGAPIGASMYDEETLASAADIVEIVGSKLVLPLDFIAGKNKDDTEPIVVEADRIPDGYMALDIGPRTREAYKKSLSGARTVFWAGPLGMFEVKNFENGTKEIANFLAGLHASVVVGGGDSAAAVNKFGVASRLSHVSTGGGASLEFIEKEGKLPGIVALEEYSRAVKTSAQSRVM